MKGIVFLLIVLMIISALPAVIAFLWGFLYA